jgi:hypothetical protein
MLVSMPAESGRITAHKAATARVIRLEDALLEAIAEDVSLPDGESEQLVKLREALREAYEERSRTQNALFGF